MPAFNTERAASALVEAIYVGDEEAARKWNTTVRTLRRWRKRLETDELLSAFVHEKKRQSEKEWASELPAALRSAIRFLKRAADEGDHKDPVAVHAVAGAFKLLFEAGITKEIVDVRLGRILGEDGAKAAAVDAARRQLASNT